MPEQPPPSADGPDHRERGEAGSEVSGPLLIVTGVAIVAGVVTRFVTRSSLWLDEALSINIASLPLGEISDALRHDGHPPLYYVLLHFWIDLFGSSDVAVRSLSGILSLAALPLAYIAGRRRAGQVGGFVTLAVFACAPFAIRYATETRMYSLVILLVLIGYLLLDDIVERGKVGVGSVVGVVVVTAALLYTHYWSMWLLAAVGLGLIWGAWRSSGGERVRRLWAIGSLAAGGVLFTPWIPTLLYQSAHTGTPWGPPVRPFAVLATTLGDFGGGQFRDAEFVGASMFVLVLLALFGVAVDRVTIRLDLRTVRQYRREVLVLTGTFAFAIAVALATGATYASRYAAVVFPLFALLVAGGITRFTGRWVLAGVLAVVVLSSSFGMYWSVTYSRSQTAALATTIGEVAQPGDLVVYCPDQLGPGGARVVPDDLEQLRFPDLGDPRFVDWVDYADRNAATDSDAVADEVLERSANRGIFVVWNGGYRTMDGVCERFVAALSTQRPNAQTLVVSDSGSNFEYAQLDYFPPSP